jgi:hypothetical protein
MVPAVHGIYRMDSQDLAGPIFHPFVVTSSIFGITGVAEMVVNLILRSEPLHVLTVHGKVLRFALFNKSRLVVFSQLFVLTEGVVLFPLNLYKFTLIDPPSMRDDLHSYLLPLLLQLFRILNVCLNRVFEEFVLFIFGQLIESLQG